MKSYYATMTPHGIRVLEPVHLHVFRARAERDAWVADDPGCRHGNPEREIVTCSEARHIGTRDGAGIFAMTLHGRVYGWPEWIRSLRDAAQDCMIHDADATMII